MADSPLKESASVNMEKQQPQEAEKAEDTASHSASTTTNDNSSEEPGEECDTAANDDPPSMSTTAEVAPDQELCDQNTTDQSSAVQQPCTAEVFNGPMHESQNINIMEEASGDDEMNPIAATETNGNNVETTSTNKLTSTNDDSPNMDVGLADGASASAAPDVQPPQQHEPQQQQEEQHPPSAAIAASVGTGPAAAVAVEAPSQPAAAFAAMPAARKKKKRSPPPIQPGQSTGRWTTAEHNTFLEGLKVFGREWKKVALRIPTRSSSQVRSHAVRNA